MSTFPSRPPAARGASASPRPGADAVAERLRKRREHTRRLRSWVVAVAAALFLATQVALLRSTPATVRTAKAAAVSAQSTGSGSTSTASKTGTAASGASKSSAASEASTSAAGASSASASTGESAAAVSTGQS